MHVNHIFPSNAPPLLGTRQHLEVMPRNKWTIHKFTCLSNFAIYILYLEMTSTYDQHTCLHLMSPIAAILTRTLLSFPVIHSVRCCEHIAGGVTMM